MTTPQITVVFDPALSTDSGAVFDEKNFAMVAGLNPWGSEANEISTFVNEKAIECTATALMNDLPDLTGQAGKFIGVNSAEDAATFYNPALGQCRLEWVSATEISLVPKNGNLVPLNGGVVPIPAAGVSLANTGLTAETVQHVYIYDNAGTPALEASTTNHSVDTTVGNIGVVIKSGDPSRSYVGTIRTDSSGQFVSTDLISHFNPPRVLRMGNEYDGTKYTRTSQTYGTTTTFIVEQLHEGSVLKCSMNYQQLAESTQTDEDAGSIARCHYYNGTDWVGVGNITGVIITQYGNSGGVVSGLEGHQTVDFILDSTEKRSGENYWQITVSHYEQHDATSSIDDIRLFWEEIA